MVDDDVVDDRTAVVDDASIAGLVNMILFTPLRLNAVIAIAIAKYVFPVPAGSSPNVIIPSLIESTYFLLSINPSQDEAAHLIRRLQESR